MALERGTSETDAGCGIAGERYPMPRMALRQGQLSFAAGDPGEAASRLWDALWRGEAPGRFAVQISPNAERLARMQAYRVEVDAPAGNWPDAWREMLAQQIAGLAVQMTLPEDRYPSLSVPRTVHGQSQGITDLFGARVEAQPDGNVFTYPLPPDPAFIDEIVPAPLETSMYWGAVEWVRYAAAATGGVFAFRHPVMTGPLDTTNYLLGSTVLLEWVYTEPDTLHRLLEKVTTVLIGMVRALQQAAGGALCPAHCPTMRGGFDLCSEVRSIISPAIYAEFEAPYLRRMGEALGTYAVHSCGSWERTLPSVLRDTHCRAMNGQVRENDLALLCQLADGKIALSINPSRDLDERYTWPDSESYFRYLLTTVPATQPMEIAIAEDNLPLWQRLHREIRGSAAIFAEPLL